MIGDDSDFLTRRCSVFWVMARKENGVDDRDATNYKEVVMKRVGMVIGLILLIGTANGCCRDVERKLNECRVDAKDAAAMARAQRAKLKSEMGKLLSGVRSKLKDAEDQNDVLTKRLEALGQDVAALNQKKNLTEAQRRKLAAQLAKTKAQMAELKKRQAQAEARARQFRELLAKFSAMIKAGKVKVTIRDGRMVVQLAEKILFDSGRAFLKKEGKAALKAVSDVLRQLPNRKFQVAGHTDNVPMRTRRYKSNWALSTARALVVVRFMIENGMSPKRLSAAGYSQFSPVVSNDTPEGRAANRRIEIVLQPNLSELPNLSGLVHN